MRKIFTTCCFLSAINSLLLILLLSGCSAVDMEEDSSTSIPVEGAEVLYISTRAEGGIPAETAIRTLRLVVYSEDNGKIVLNRLFMTNDAAPSIPDKSLTYFARIGDAYQIAVLIPKGTIRVIMIANEIEALDSPLLTLDGLKKSLIKYYDTYHDNDGALNIQLDATSASSNIGYLPMYAESRKLYYPDWNGFEKVVAINLVRTLAKVSLQITGIDLSKETEKGTLIINSASIINAAKHSLWGDSISPYEGTPTNTITKVFDQKVSNDGAINTSDKLEFYIPGHVVSDNDLTHKGYTYIQINATFTPESGSAINSTYEIPLGNGVQAKGYKLDAMTAADLKVSRNKIYQVEAKVVSNGKLSVVSINAKVKEWDEENINVDIDPPCLNVSSIDWMYNNDAGGMNRIYFWSNMGEDKIKLDPVVEIINGESTRTAAIQDVFEGLLFEASKDPPTNFHFYKEGDESLYFNTNGYFDLKKKDAVVVNGEVVKIKFVAGNVKKRISVTMP